MFSITNLKKWRQWNQNWPFCSFTLILRFVIRLSQLKIAPSPSLFTYAFCPLSFGIQGWDGPTTSRLFASVLSSVLSSLLSSICIPLIIISVSTYETTDGRSPITIAFKLELQNRKFWDGWIFMWSIDCQLLRSWLKKFGENLKLNNQRHAWILLDKGETFQV